MRRSRFVRAHLATLSLVLLALSVPVPSDALISFWLVPPPGGPISMVICKDGTSIIFPGPPELHMAPGSPGHNFCSNHGGIADITDGSLQSALEEIATCVSDSTFSFGQDLGGGTYDDLTPVELDQFVQQAEQQGMAELVGFELLSLRVGGRELVPAAVPNLTRHPLYGARSDENEDGNSVGGLTQHPTCALREVPVPRSTAPLLLVALAAFGSGALLLRRGSRET